VTFSHLVRSGAARFMVPPAGFELARADSATPPISSSDKVSLDDRDS